jgi:hypothetical protein
MLNIYKRETSYQTDKLWPSIISIVLLRHRIAVYQLLVYDRWFSPGTPASSTTKSGRHDIAEILLESCVKHNKL